MGGQQSRSQPMTRHVTMSWDLAVIVIVVPVGTTRGARLGEGDRSG